MKTLLLLLPAALALTDQATLAAASTSAQAPKSTSTSTSTPTPARVQAKALPAPKSRFQFKQGWEDFVSLPEKNLTVSEKCLKAGDKLKCEAVSGLEKISLRKTLDVTPGSADPASAICERQLKGTVVVGRNEKGSENGFCRFSDGSMIDSGSLEFRARRNDE